MGKVSQYVVGGASEARNRKFGASTKIHSAAKPGNVTLFNLMQSQKTIMAMSLGNLMCRHTNFGKDFSKKFYRLLFDLLKFWACSSGRGFNILQAP